MSINRGAILKTILGFIIAIIALVLFSPLLLLPFLQTSLGRHIYREISFTVIASNELPESATEKELIQSAIDYARDHLWVFSDSRPYPGKPFDYLIEGVGWCDYYAKILCKLLAAKGMHARYAFLLDKNRLSPHTVAEVYVKDKWRGVDPLLDIIYYDRQGEMVELERLTPEMIAAMPGMVSIKKCDGNLYETIVNFAGETYPLPHQPKRSESFLSEKHIFDFIAAMYVKILGRKFTNLYQDIFLKQAIAGIDEPVRQLWVKARNYHLYARLSQAEPIYAQIIRNYPRHTYRKRSMVFLSHLLIEQQRFKEALVVLQQFLSEYPEDNWQADCRYYIGLCYEGLLDIPKAITYYKQTQGAKFYLDACQRLVLLLE